MIIVSHASCIANHKPKAKIELHVNHPAYQRRAISITMKADIIGFGARAPEEVCDFTFRLSAKAQLSRVSAVMCLHLGHMTRVSDDGACKQENQSIPSICSDVN